MEENKEYKYVVGISFGQGHPYYFSCNEEIKKDTRVVVETVRGVELATCSVDSKDIKEFKQEFELKPIVRLGTEEDEVRYKENLALAEVSRQKAIESIEKFNLDMKLLKAEYTLDRTKVIFTYASDNRVDFRELLKELAYKLKCRIELRQIGSRDRSKLVGGLGVCGLPLCCNIFLNEFDGIGINMAKNQFLALNIQKLSGQCGKLTCCLKYEDDQYTELRKTLPKIGTRLTIEDKQYKLTNINVLTNQVRLENNEGIIMLPIVEVEKLIKEQIHE